MNGVHLVGRFTPVQSMLQFGRGYSNPLHFKRRFLSYLKTVLLYCPQARLEQRPAGLLRSRLPVLRSDLARPLTPDGL